jgi:hypothetical protein
LASQPMPAMPCMPDRPTLGGLRNET